MAKRQSIQFPGFSHANPIPNASRVGNIMMSSVIVGRDPESGNMPADLDQQIHNIFAHIASAMSAAGSTPEAIVKVTFWMKDPASGRQALNGDWEAMFPDPASRPARHTQSLAETGASQVKCDFMAVLD